MQIQNQSINICTTILYTSLDLSSISTCFGYRWSTCWYIGFNGSFIKGRTFARSGTSTPSPTAIARCEFWLKKLFERIALHLFNIPPYPTFSVFFSLCVSIKTRPPSNPYSPSPTVQPSAPARSTWTPFCVVGGQHLPPHLNTLIYAFSLSFYLKTLLWKKFECSFHYCPIAQQNTPCHHPKKKKIKIYIKCC